MEIANNGEQYVTQTFEIKKEPKMLNQMELCELIIDKPI